MEHFSKKGLIALLIAGVMSLALVGSTYIATKGFLKSRTPSGVITVTGSAKKQIKSDFAVWNGSFSVQSKTISEAYSGLKNNQNTVKKYLVGKGIPEVDMSISSINTSVNYVRTYQGINTSEVESYKLTQTVEIKSNDVEKISAIAREATELIDKGVEFHSMPPQFFYTKIADLKIDMLALATKDAKARAEKIAENSGTQITGLKSSKMGVFQITALYSNQISDYGINDTSSIDKEIMSVMNCEFKIK